MKVVVPIIHMNGSGATNLVGLRVEMLAKLDAAINALGAMAPNGRDYYPVPGKLDEALAAHQERLDALNNVRNAIEVECIAIQDLEDAR